MIVRVSICPCIAKKKAALPKNSQRNCAMAKTAKALDFAGFESVGREEMLTLLK